MESRSTKQSPSILGNNSGSWIQYWDGDDGSVSGLNIDHSRELHNLVEDKEIAARAVAFVVNSTRKGIVPLCADVANLLRTKRRLENKVHKLRGDNDKLRASLSASSRNSNSTSPTPASVHSSCHRSQGQCSQCCCSDCSSQCDSFSNSPKLDKSFSSPRSSCNHHGSAFTPPHAYEERAEVTVHEGALHCPIEGSGDIKRNRSLPEMVSQPSANIVKIRPTVSTETQCSLSGSGGASLEQQFRETLQHNTRLAEQLGAARTQIELLKGKLKELEMNQLARETLDRFHTENEIEQPSTPFLRTSISSQALGESVTIGTPGMRSATSQPDVCQLEGDRAAPTAIDMSKKPETATVKRKLNSAVLAPSPLEGCRCITCADPTTKPHPLYHSRNRLKVEALPGDHVVLKGEKTGRVRYLGHLDGVGQPQVVFAGVQLDAPVGRHDGVVNGRRYFSCERDCGIFVPLHEVCCVISPQSKTPVSPTISPITAITSPSFPTETTTPLRRGCLDRSSSSLSTSRDLHKMARREKEKRFTPTEMDLKLPKNSQLAEGHLV